MKPDIGGAPEVTLVIASYRYGHLAAQAIESALSQSRPFAKILFVDDGVGDCAHLPALYPQLEYVMRPKNLGVVANFQDMLMRVDTPRVMFLGADNWLRDDTVEALSAVQADVVTYDIFVTGNLRDEILSRHPSEVRRENGGWYWDRSAGHHGSMLYDTKRARAVGGYDSAPGRTLEDQVLYQRLLRDGARRVHVAEALLMYRRHSQNFNPC
ncbi:MAG: glycosyltransferase [Maritimibacter sp.]|nr:glycosyltransferase [Maritimibacter sp.]